MPQNPNLFPPVYSDLCPGTGLAETDRITELQDLLQVLRQQFLLGNRRDGQGLSELQNQSIAVSNSLAPQPGVGRTLAFAGANPVWYGYSAQIDKLNHASKTITPIEFVLNFARWGASAGASAFKAYVAGGAVPGAGTYEPGVATTNGIEAIVWDSESKASVGVTLSSGGRFQAGTVQSTSSLYIAGGATFATPLAPFPANFLTSIQKFNLQIETISTLGSTLPTISGYTVGCRSATKGFLIGATNLNINSITFSNDSLTNESSQLSVGRTTGAGFQSFSTGYFANGHAAYVNYGSNPNDTSPGHLVNNRQDIDSLNFGTGTVTQLSNSLTLAADSNRIGSQSSREGFILGGYYNYASTRAIDVFAFNSNTLSTAGDLLSRGGRSMAAAEKL